MSLISFPHSYRTLSFGQFLESCTQFEGSYVSFHVSVKTLFLRLLKKLIEESFIGKMFLPDFRPSYKN